MPEVRGLVQRIKMPMIPGGYWVYIGPSPTNTTLFYVDLSNTTDPQTRCWVEAITGALFARREVTIWHTTGDSRIEHLDIVPG